MTAWSFVLLLCQLFSIVLGYGETPVPATSPTPVTNPPPVTYPSPPYAPPAQTTPPPPQSTPPPPPPPQYAPPPPQYAPSPPQYAPPPPPQYAPPPPQSTPPPPPPPQYAPPPTTPITPPGGATPGVGSTELIVPEVSVVVKQSITIYYDAMEEKSQIFFNTTLTKKFDEFYPYIDFNYVPCQQVQIIDGNPFCYNPIDPTCKMNQVHACAIAQTNDKLITSKFLICTMKGTAALPDFNSCATSSGIDATKLQTCLDSGLGKQLCILFRSEKPSECNSLPGFIFKNPKDIKQNDPFNHFLNDACSTDFISTTCAVLKSSKKPTPVHCNKQKLAVSISYKIMDENSYKVIQEWAKLYDKFGKFFTIHFKPCMLAEMKNGHLDCKSEKDKDCITGKMQSCAISLVTDKTALFKFIACSSKDAHELANFENCAKENKLNFNSIKECVDSGVGSRLCYESSRTRPNTKKMPIIRFEMKFNKAVSEESWKNLQFVLCQEFKSYNLTLPEECKSKAKLSIFYDSLDPEFQCFLSTKFMNNYAKFSPFLNFDFVPCRTAKEENGNVVCPNKLDNKCYIDKFEACTVKNFPDNDISLKILLCLSQGEGAVFPGHESCVLSAQLDGTKLKDCANGDDGKKLCIDNAKKSPKNDRTMAFQFNDKWDENIDNKIAEDFSSGLCKVLKDSNTSYPVDCYPTPDGK